jgi:hypothetical protein
MRPRDGGRLGVHGLAVTRRTGLELPENLTLEGWRTIGRQIALIVDSAAWWLGDWLVFGQDKYPGRYRQVIEATGLEYQTLKNYAWVCRKIPRSRRRDALSFQHHAVVSGLPAGEQDLWLGRAERSQWSMHRLRRELRSGRQADPAAAGPVTVVRLDPGPERATRWQQAADRQGCALIAWIITVLDQAAQAAGQ